MMVIALTVMTIAAMAPAAVAQQTTQNVQQLEREIEQHEKNIKEKETAIKDLEARIDSMKSVLKDLENQKKSLEKDVKNETKMRKDKFTVRDELVYDEEIADVLYNPYNKGDVEEALDSFEGMETKDVIKKKELVEKYGEYTKNLKEYMEKMKKELAANKWKYSWRRPRKNSPPASGNTCPRPATFTRSSRRASRAPSTGKSITRRRKTRVSTTWIA